jgi:TM2 domain-containing membrane protein YozV
MSEQPTIIINNNQSIENSGNKKLVSKWVAFFWCLFFGVFGFHKFYEGKIGMGILYLLTFGFMGIGVCIDLLVLLFRPRKYYI